MKSFQAIQVWFVSQRGEEGTKYSSNSWKGNRAVKTVKLASASRSLAEYAKELDEEIMVVTERNKPIAAVVPLKHVDRESLALSSPRIFGYYRAGAAGVCRWQNLVSRRDEESGSTSEDG